MPLTPRALIFAAAAIAILSVAGKAGAADRYASYVMDARTGEVLEQDAADDVRHPASLTKMMTLYMIFGALRRGDIAMDTRWMASPNAAGQPSTHLGLRCSDTTTCDDISVEQAISALIVQSANDVAVLSAEHLAGSEAQFCLQMNEHARILGMTNTNFVNASGLPDPRQQTSAHDIATLARALWRDFPEYYHFFGTETFLWMGGVERNHNHLLGHIVGVDGIKTGYTQASGFNIAAMAERRGRRVIVIVMGGESASDRDAQASYLIESAFEEYARRDAHQSVVTVASAQSTRLVGIVTSLAAAN